MPTFVSGLPVHVLVVHAVVVLVPLAVLGAIAVIVWPAARRRYGWLVVGVTAVATAVIPLATSSGEGLEHRLPRTALLQTHTHLGDELLVFVAGMLVALGVFVALHRMAGTKEGPGAAAAPARTLGGARRGVAVAAGALTIALAVVSAVQVYRIGDSGARAAWSATQYLPATSGD